MKQKKAFDHDVIKVKEDFKSAFMMMKISHIYQQLIKLDISPQVIYDVIRMNKDQSSRFFDNYHVRARNPRRNAEHFALTVGWLWVHDFSINQMMRHQGCAQSKIYKGLEQFERWVEGEDSLNEYVYVEDMFTHVNVFDSHLDNILEICNLLQHRRL